MTQTKEILLAEDEDHIAKLITFKLSKENFVVTTARDGGEAISLLDKKSWSLIILDIMMPVCDGWEVLKCIRSKTEFDALPVLMLTAKGYQNVEVVSHAEMGAQQYLKKPFDPENLAKLVKRMVSEHS